MQSYDYASIALLLLAAAATLARGVAPWLRLTLFGLAVFATCLQLEQTGPHWQMFPAYLALVTLFILQIGKLSTSRFKPWIASAALLPALASAAFCWVLPIFSLPAPTGPYAVGTALENDCDPARPELLHPNVPCRELVYQVWYPVAAGTRGTRARYTRPAELKPLWRYEASIRTNALASAPAAQGKFPVLLFGHMWGGSRFQDTFLAEELASHGYVVVSLDHPFNAARVLLPTGEVVLDNRADAVDSSRHEAPSIRQSWSADLVTWVADDRAVLDRLEPGNCPAGRPYCGHMELDRIGAFGHSFGGCASIALLGADPRVKSAVNLDGWTFEGIDHRTSQPVLFVYEGNALPRVPGIGADGELDAQDNAGVDASLDRFGGTRAYVDGTLHLDFTDRTLLSPLRRLTYTGPIRGERIRTITRGLVLGFFDQTLKGTGSLPTYPEVKLEQYPAR